MSLRFFRIVAVITPLANAFFTPAVDRPEVTYKIFQFTADRIPRMDGSTDDWAMVPDEYAIGMDQLVDDEGGHTKPDSKNLDARVRVGWVVGLNRLYFLYEAYDNYWDFSDPGLRNDTFEIVVDGDASGGPLIDKGHRELWTAQQVGASSATPDNRISVEENHWAVHGVHAQNYHIFTPARDKDWCMAWSSATWIKELPFANAAYRYSFKPGEPGRLTLEFWVTPFDYAGPEGPQRAVESVLSENKIIGLSWAIIDYDDPKSGKRSFWNLSRKHTMYGNASELCAFKLMPLEPHFRKPIEAQWSYKVVDMDRRLVAFKDLSRGKITSWRWSFGDGETSTEQNPMHEFKRAGSFVTILEVAGPGGLSRRSKVWEVSLRWSWIDPLAHAPMAQLAWNAVTTKINAEGQVEGTCVGTGMAFDPTFYCYRPVSVYAAHGYGLVLLAGAEMIRLLKNHVLDINDGALQVIKKGPTL